VNSLLFVFRALGLAYQDVAIALLGRGRDGFAELKRFAGRMGLAITGILAAIAFTPLSDVWFRTVSGLSPELTAYALPAARIMVPLPFLGVCLSLERGVLMKNRLTRPITMATASEVVTIAVFFLALGWGIGMVGVTAAFTALVFGRIASTGYLIPATRLVLRDDASGEAEAPLVAGDREIEPS
jgi:O-antigen/teichoic acid export membrane protein